jgi:hypothetical protein
MRTTLSVLVVGLVAAGGCRKKQEPTPERLLDTGWFVDTAERALDPDTCLSRFVDSRPAGGEGQWYWRDRPVLFTATDHQAAYDAWLVDADGNRLDTEMVWAEGGVSFELVWDGFLAPSTDYTLWRRDCSVTEAIEFTTSELGTPIVGGPESLVGTTFRLDLINATWVEPGALSTLMALYFTTPILLGVQYADGSHLDLLGAPGEVDAFGAIQQANAPTWDFPLQPFDQQPYFVAEVDSIQLDYQSGNDLIPIPVQDFVLAGTIGPDGATFGGGEISGLADTRELSDVLPGGGDDDGAVCDFAESLGVSCQACDDGLPYCLRIIGVDIEGARVDGLSLDR